MLKTTDIILASCLKLEGYTLHDIQLNGNKGTFVFDDPDEDWLKKYNLDQIRVSPKQFNDAIKTLTTSVRTWQR